MSRISDAWEDRAIELLKTATVEELVALHPLTRAPAEDHVNSKPYNARQSVLSLTPTETAPWAETPKDEAAAARGEASDDKPVAKAAIDDFEARFEAIKKKGR